VPLDNPLRAGCPFEPYQFGGRAPAEQGQRAEAAIVDGGDNGASGVAMGRDEARDNVGGDVRLVAQQKDSDGGVRGSDEEPFDARPD
jgi:hypothetical protein